MSEFSHRSSHGAKAGRRRLLALTALVVLLLLIDLITGGGVRGLVRSVTASVWASTERARLNISESGYFSSRRALADDNARLRAEVALLREKAAAHDVLESEVAQLRTALALAGGNTGVTAPVVSSFRSSPYGSFLIGVGSDDSVAAGDLVITAGGFLVGVVSEVLGRTASVKEIFAAGESVDALIGETAVIVEGSGGGNAETSVPRGIEVHEGDAVIALQYGARALGIVGKVESSPASADQRVFIRLPLNLSSLRYVFVLHAP
jgi:cell shape-determining protein MreC